MSIRLRSMLDLLIRSLLVASGYLVALFISAMLLAGWQFTAVSFARQRLGDSCTELPDRCRGRYPPGAITVSISGSFAAAPYPLERVN